MVWNMDDMVPQVKKKKKNQVYTNTQAQIPYEKKKDIKTQTLRH